MLLHLSWPCKYQMGYPTELGSVQLEPSDQKCIHKLHGTGEVQKPRSKLAIQPLLNILVSLKCKAVAAMFLRVKYKWRDPVQPGKSNFLDLSANCVVSQDPWTHLLHNSRTGAKCITYAITVLSTLLYLSWLYIYQMSYPTDCAQLEHFEHFEQMCRWKNRLKTVRPSSQY